MKFTGCGAYPRHETYRSSRGVCRVLLRRLRRRRGRAGRPAHPTEAATEAPTEAATEAPTEAAASGAKLAIAADPDGAIKFTETELTADAGQVEIDFSNPSRRCRTPSTSKAWTARSPRP